MPEPELVAAPVTGIRDSRSKRSHPIVGAPDVRRLLFVPDADRPAVAGNDVPADVNVQSALIRGREARQSVGPSATLACESAVQLGRVVIDV